MNKDEFRTSLKNQHYKDVKKIADDCFQNASPARKSKMMAHFLGGLAIDEAKEQSVGFFFNLLGPLGAFRTLEHGSEALRVVKKIQDSPQVIQEKLIDVVARWCEHEYKH